MCLVAFCQLSNKRIYMMIYMHCCRFAGGQQYNDNNSQQYDSVRPPHGFADTDVDSAGNYSTL